MCDVEDDEACRSFVSMLLSNIACCSTDFQGCTLLHGSKADPTSAGLCMEAQPCMCLMTNATVSNTMQDTHHIHLILHGSPALEYGYTDHDNSSTMDYIMNPRVYPSHPDDSFIILPPEESEDGDGCDLMPDQDGPCTYHSYDWEDYDEYDYPLQEEYVEQEYSPQLEYGPHHAYGPQPVETQQNGLAWYVEMMDLREKVQLLSQQLEACARECASYQQQCEAERQRVLELEGQVRQLAAAGAVKDAELDSRARKLKQTTIQLAEARADTEALKQLARVLGQQVESCKAAAAAAAAATTLTAGPSGGLGCSCRAPAGALPPVPSCSLLARAATTPADTPSPATLTSTSRPTVPTPNTSTPMRGVPSKPTNTGTAAPCSSLAGKAGTFQAPASSNGMCAQAVNTCMEATSWNAVLMGIVTTEGRCGAGGGASGLPTSAPGNGPYYASSALPGSRPLYPCTNPAGLSSTFAALGKLACDSLLRA